MRPPGVPAGVPPVRGRSAYGALSFAAFSIFWSTTALQLSRDPFHCSPAVIGLFGLLGAAGAMAANLTGRVKRHTHPMPTAVAVVLIAVACAVLSAAGRTLGGIIAGVPVLGIGVRGCTCSTSASSTTSTRRPVPAVGLHLLRRQEAGASGP
ncbi:hypothetical protein [Streptomyces sp. NPDC007905]|uniref:hypothetical protein n=1 Tax=Streptomyces sp. NPDC007905 TaxID=3364788 RepID=UPI0036EB4B37